MADVTKKTPCPVSRAEFSEHAKELEFVIDGNEVVAKPQQFSTGSMGWYFGDKINVRVNGKLCKAQVGVNITLVNSKDLPPK